MANLGNLGQGEGIVLLAAAIAVELCQNKEEKELLALAAFFDVLGDNIALILAQRVL